MDPDWNKVYIGFQCLKAHISFDETGRWEFSETSERIQHRRRRTQTGVWRTLPRPKCTDRAKHLGNDLINSRGRPAPRRGGRRDAGKHRDMVGNEVTLTQFHLLTQNHDLLTTGSLPFQSVQIIETVHSISCRAKNLYATHERYCRLRAEGFLRT
jgi:hypothetical protein